MNENDEQEIEPQIQTAPTGYGGDKYEYSTGYPRLIHYCFRN